MDPEPYLRQALAPHPEAVEDATTQKKTPLYSVALTHHKNRSIRTTDVRVEAFPRLFEDQTMALEVIERAAEIARELNPKVSVQIAFFVHDDGGRWAAFVD
ncbi:hypothetical protein UK99_01625 [Frankia casuarinae]|uniref:hypothetical protein n=1 Tax=Frankia casuarinae (strain DSM 45818 / CECT 9043 / HFP020203 / CcI3) TaxID=106370 RepID=UPI000A10A08B|nr:hypothetical protein [Frankia casuarinae]ORT98466.1 hypothetical protein UK99_01625 [Frankia casuarinae]